MDRSSAHRTGRFVKLLTTVCAPMLISAGVIYAVTTAQASLAASTLSTKTASLRIRTTGHAWSTIVRGFRITNLTPGQGTTEHVYFKNAGRVGLQISAHVPKTPAVPKGGYGFSGWQNLLVDITGDNCGTTLHTTMAQLLGSSTVNLPCGALPAGVSGDPTSPRHQGNYSLHFDFVQDAIAGDHAGLGSFDLVFTGTQL